MLYRQDHDGIYVARNSGDRWIRVGQHLSDDFGMNVVTTPTHPGRAFFIPLLSGPRIIDGNNFQVQRWDERSRVWSSTVPRHKWPGSFAMHREAMAADALDPAGIYVGTATGQLFWSADSGHHWKLIPFQFPGI